MSDKVEAFDISSFLAGQVAEGELESEGRFTVSQDDAARKLARFSMPFDYAWVLKVVQAALAWNSARVDVRQYRTFSLFTFCPGDTASLPTEEEFLGVLLSGKMLNSEPLALLCQGLRSLVEQAGLSFRLLVEVPGRAGRPIHAGPDANGLALEERLSRVDSVTGFRLMVAHLPLERYLFGRFVPRLLLSDRPDLQIAKALQRFCSLCPVPLTLDKRRVDGLLESSDWGYQFRRRPLFLAAATDFAVPTWHLPEEFEEKVLSINTLPRRAKRGYGGAKSGNIWLYATGIQLIPGDIWENQVRKSRLISHHKVYFLHHGVIVDCHQVRIPTEHVELSIFVGAEGLPTDLSGLALSRGEELEKVMNVVRGVVAKKLSRLMSEPEDFLRDVPDAESSRDRRIERLAMESHRDARRLLGADYPVLSKGVAATIFMGRSLTDAEHEPAEIVDSLAREWHGALLRDLDELETLQTAVFQGTNWLTLD